MFFKAVLVKWNLAVGAAKKIIVMDWPSTPPDPIDGKMGLLAADRVAAAFPPDLFEGMTKVVGFGQSARKEIVVSEYSLVVMD
jgi:hypothetical protein